MTANESHPDAGRHDATPPASGVESRAETARSYRPVVLAALTVALITLCALLAYPFLPAITWGVALAILAWPMHHAIRRRVQIHSLAAALSTAAVVAVIVLTAGFGLLFWWSGLPAPFLWTAFLFILSLLPILGAAMVWLPSAGYLAMTGGWGAAAAVLGWGALTFVTVDNFLYVRLAGDRMQMHPVPALIAFLGAWRCSGRRG